MAFGAAGVLRGAQAAVRHIALRVLQRESHQAFCQFERRRVTGGCVETHGRHDGRGVVLLNARAESRRVMTPAARAVITLRVIQAVGVPRGDAQQPVYHALAGRAIPLVAGVQEAGGQSQQRAALGPADLGQRFAGLPVAQQHVDAPRMRPRLAGQPGQAFCAEQPHHPCFKLGFSGVGRGCGPSRRQHGASQGQRIDVPAAAVAAIPQTMICSRRPGAPRGEEVHEPVALRVEQAGQGTRRQGSPGLQVEWM